MKQVFVTDLKAHFNLRSKRGLKPTNIYFVVSYKGKQYKLPTDVKVYPFQWNKKKQIAIVSNELDNIDNANNTIANEELAKISQRYEEFISYICSKGTTNIINDLKRYMKQDKLKEVDITKFMWIAFNEFYLHKSTKESSKNVIRQKIEIFCSWVNANNMNNDKEAISQRGINDFTDYLLKKGTSSKQTQTYVDAVCMLINKELRRLNEFYDYHFEQVEAPSSLIGEKVTNVRYPLNKEELSSLETTKLDGKLDAYRWLFLLQCECGLRFGDLLKLFKGEYNEEKDNMISVEIEKSRASSKTEIAIIDVTERFKSIYKRCDNLLGDKIRSRKKRTIEDEFNATIKEIAKQCGINRKVEQYKQVDGKKVTYKEELCNIITSHFARHTFVKNMVLNGYEENDIIKFTGHTSTNMVHNIYSHTSKEDIINNITKLKREREKKIEDESEKGFAVNAFINASKMLQSGNDGYHLPSTIKAIKIMKDLSLIGGDKDKALSIKDIVFDIAYHFKDTQLIAAYQMKLKKIGAISEVETEEEIELRFYEYDKELQKLKEDDELKRYQNGTLNVPDKYLNDDGTIKEN
jgi:integrase